MIICEFVIDSIVKNKVKRKWDSGIRIAVRLKSVNRLQYINHVRFRKPFIAMKNKDWFKPRGYLHIDSKINSEDRQDVVNIVSNRKYVAKHAFLPLIYKTIGERRYKKLGKTKEGKQIRSHSEEGKSTKKIRPIHYASHIDSQIYAFYNHKIISPAYEELLNQILGLSDCVSAYRRIEAPEGHRNKCNIHFAMDAIEEIKQRKECIAIALDIKSFFSSLDHKILLERWTQVLHKDRLPDDHYNLYKSVTQFRYINLNDFRTVKGGFDEREIASFCKKGVESFFSSMKQFRERVKAKEFIVRKNQFIRNELGKKFPVGIPQGLPISALLANIYMYKFDLDVFNELCKKNGVFYRRYSDDIVLICNNDQREFVEKFVNELISGDQVKLELSKQKTERILFKEIEINGHSRLQSFSLNSKGEKIFNIPFSYLGFEFYGYQTLIKASKISNFYRRMKRAVRRQHYKAEVAKERNLETRKIVYKRRLYRLFTYKGEKKRELPLRTKYILTQDDLGYWHRKPISIPRKHRGNALRYANTAAKIMNAPEIRKQYRNHFRILQETIKRYNFDNCKKD